jgi:hypothetical protein
MYCSSCGVAVGKGLSYCNYCGAKLSSTDNTSLEFREVRPGLLVSAMAGIFVLGLPGIAFIIFMLNAALRLDSQQTMAFAWITLILLFGLEFIFLMLLLRQRRRKGETREADQLNGSNTNELEAKSHGILTEPVASVTEHTTRAFDAIPRQRN